MTGARAALPIPVLAAAFGVLMILTAALVIVMFEPGAKRIALVPGE